MAPSNRGRVCDHVTAGMHTIEKSACPVHYMPTVPEEPTRPTAHERCTQQSPLPAQKGMLKYKRYQYRTASESNTNDITVSTTINALDCSNASTKRVPYTTIIF